MNTLNKKLFLTLLIFQFFCLNQIFSQKNDFEKELAYKYAPNIWFHKDEKYFPCSPLFWLETGVDRDDRQIYRKSVTLLTPEDRKKEYDTLRDQGKHLQIAKVFYDVYQIKIGSKEYNLLSKYIENIDSLSKIYIIEYWFYYIYNEYRIGYKKFGVKQNHFHDLEHVFFVVSQNENQIGYDQNNVNSNNILLIIANAHEDSTPNNIFILKGTNFTLQKHLNIIVEKGSHASCPDIDGDGFAVAGIDINDKRFNRIAWGIRDYGQPFAGYIVDFMDQRIEELGYIKLNHPGTIDAADSKLRYRLISVEELQTDFKIIFSRSEEKRKLFRIFPKQIDPRYLGSILLNKDPKKLYQYQPWKHPHNKNIKKLINPDNWQFLSLKLGFSYYDNIPSVTLTDHIQFKHVTGWPFFKNLSLELSLDQVRELIFNEMLKRERSRWVGRFEYNLYISHDIDNFFSFYWGIGSTRLKKEYNTENYHKPEVDWTSFIGGMKFNYSIISTRVGLRVRDDIDRGFVEFRVWLNLYDFF